MLSGSWALVGWPSIFVCVTCLEWWQYLATVCHNLRMFLPSPHWNPVVHTAASFNTFSGFLIFYIAIMSLSQAYLDILASHTLQAPASRLPKPPSLTSRINPSKDSLALLGLLTIRGGWYPKCREYWPSCGRCFLIYPHCGIKCYLLMKGLDTIFY